MIRRQDHAMAALVEGAARGAAFPETPPLAGRVRARIEAGPIPVAEIDLPRTRPSPARPVAVAVLAVAIAVTAALSVSVTARRAVADLLGVVGIRVTFDDAGAPAPRPAHEIGLGEPVSAEVASELSGLDVLVPEAARGTPSIHYDPRIGERGMVSVVYPAGAETVADVDLLVSQFAAALPEDYVKKLPSLGSRIRYTTVRGAAAYWIGGEPHLFFYEDDEGSVRRETARLAGNVLLWADDGVTYRIEGAGSLREARLLAESLR